jgi:hypothetical protein
LLAAFYFRRYGYTASHQPEEDIESSIGPIFYYKMQYLAKKQHFFGLDSGKISICGDKTET